MTRCPVACRPTIETDSPINSNQLKNKSAKKRKAHQEAKSYCWVHIEEIPETQPETKVEPPPGFSCPNLDGMDQGNQLLVWFVNMQLEEIGAMQTISQ